MGNKIDNKLSDSTLDFIFLFTSVLIDLVVIWCIVLGYITVIDIDIDNIIFNIIAYMFIRTIVFICIAIIAKDFKVNNKLLELCFILTVPMYISLYVLVNIEILTLFEPDNNEN